MLGYLVLDFSKSLQPTYNDERELIPLHSWHCVQYKFLLDFHC